MPLKADAPLLVDADTVLPCSVANELFESVGRRNAQVSESLGVAKHAKLTVGDLLDVLRQFARASTGEDLLGFLIPEGLDHNPWYNEAR